jgi:hypothetical protein
VLGKKYEKKRKPLCKKMVSATLSISGKRVCCEEVANMMSQLGVNGDVSANTTSIDGFLEPGCRIMVASKDSRADVYRLWTAVQTRFDLTCAHTAITHHENGCIFDVFRKSTCPGK